MPLWTNRVSRYRLSSPPYRTKYALPSSAAWRPPLLSSSPHSASADFQTRHPFHAELHRPSPPLMERVFVSLRFSSCTPHTSLSLAHPPPPRPTLPPRSHSHSRHHLVPLSRLALTRTADTTSSHSPASLSLAQPTPPRPTLPRRSHSHSRHHLVPLSRFALTRTADTT
jgi:hypothetical protein